VVLIQMNFSNTKVSGSVSQQKTEETLRRSEAYLAEAQRLSYTGSWADDGTMQPLYFSDEMYRIYEFDPRQGIPGANQCLERVHPEDRERFLQAFDKMIRLKRDAEDDFRIVMPDGRVKYLHGIGHPVLDANGDLVELVGTTVDVTERTLAEQTLALRSFALNNARDAVALINEQGRLTYVNDQSCRQSGYTHEELLRMYAWDIDCDLTIEEWPSRWQELKTHRSLTFESHHRSKDGTILPVELSVTYLEYRGTVFNLAIVRDISERKRAEQALRRSEAYLAEAQRLTHTGSWANDCNLRPVYWSEEHYRIFGLDPRQGLPTHQEVLDRIHPEDRSEVLEAFDRMMGDKTETEVEYRLAMPDGRRKYVHGIGHAVLDESGELREIVGTTVDITERKHAEQARARMHQLEADLAHINRVSIMGELTASIAHEVNQPLSGVVSNGSACLRWLAGNPPNIGEARETASRIVRDGKRAAEIISRIRALTKRSATPIEKLDLNEVIREVLALVGDEAKKKTAVIRTQFADDLAQVSGDRVQLQQVVLNLVMNAMEAMSAVTDRPRELTIITRNTAEHEVKVTVEDSGTGLDSSAATKIFDPFYTTKTSGMGMGLSICRSILQAHEGRLWAGSKAGPGAVFHFTLPREPDEEIDAGRAGI
jgi:PAS domain S-box-containing protein